MFNNVEKFFQYYFPPIFNSFDSIEIPFFLQSSLILKDTKPEITDTRLRRPLANSRSGEKIILVESHDRLIAIVESIFKLFEVDERGKC